MDKRNNIVNVLPIKAIAILLISANLYGFYEILGIQSPQLFDYLSGFVYAAVITLVVIPGTLIIAFLWNWMSGKRFKNCFLSTYKFFLNLNSFTLIALVAYSVIASDDLNYVNDEPLVYRIESANINPSDINVLHERFLNILPSRYSRVLIDTEKNKITFLRGHPNENLVNFLSQNKGEFRVYREEANAIWLNNSHLNRVEVKNNYDGKIALSILFTQEGGKILYTNTRQSLSEPVIIEVDNQIISQSKVSSPLGISIIVPLKEELNPDFYAILLNYGVLSTNINLKKI